MQTVIDEFPGHSKTREQVADWFAKKLGECKRSALSTDGTFRLKDGRTYRVSQDERGYLVWRL